MRMLTLAEVRQLGPGEIVPSIRCQIKTVGKLNQGDNEYGHWTIQKMTVLDATGILTLKLFSPLPEYTSQWQGIWIQAESSPSDKGGKLRGMMVVDDEYRGKVERQLHLKEGAIITQSQPDSAPAAPEPTRTAPPPQQAPIQAPLPISPAPEPPQAAPEPGSQARQPVKPQASVDDVRRAIAACREKLAVSANGMILCFDAAIYVANQVSAKHTEIIVPLFPPDVIEKVAISLWISLERSGLHVGLPVGPLEAWAKKAKPEPPPPPIEEASA